MTNPVFIRAPEFVKEIRPTPGLRIFRRAGGRNYREISPREFTSILRERLRARNIVQPVVDTEHVTEIRCIAGLKSGVYKCGPIEFLNPRWVPLCEPEALPSPDAAFTDRAARLGELMASNQRPAERTVLRHALRHAYCLMHGVRHVNRGHGPWSLLGQRGRCKGFPDDDHCEMFQGPRGLIWTSQPYGCDWPEILGFARFHRLSVRVTPAWSWYFPGRTVLIEWRARRAERTACSRRPKSTSTRTDSV